MTKKSSEVDAKIIPFHKRPRCISKRCKNPGQLTGNYRVDGTPLFRKTCSSCHSKAVGKKNGMKSLGHVVAAKAGMTLTEYQLVSLKKRAKKAGMTVAELNRHQLKKRAEKAGMTVAELNRHQLKKRAEKAGMTVADYVNRSHPYRKYRKSKCENRDGSILPYKCTTVVRLSAQLHVDHKNGDPTDNRPRNLQTLCVMCHVYKTHANKDYASPGRKAYKKAA